MCFREEGTTRKALCWGNWEGTGERTARDKEWSHDLCRVPAGEQGAKPKLAGDRGLISVIRGVETEVGEVSTAQKLG